MSLVRHERVPLTAADLVGALMCWGKAGYAAINVALLVLGAAQRLAAPGAVAAAGVVERERWREETL